MKVVEVRHEPGASIRRPSSLLAGFTTRSTEEKPHITKWEIHPQTRRSYGFRSAEAAFSLGSWFWLDDFLFTLDTHLIPSRTQLFFDVDTSRISLVLHLTDWQLNCP